MLLPSIALSSGSQREIPFHQIYNEDISSCRCMTTRRSPSNQSVVLIVCCQCSLETGCVPPPPLSTQRRLHLLTEIPSPRPSYNNPSSTLQLLVTAYVHASVREGRCHGDGTMNLAPRSCIHSVNNTRRHFSCVHCPVLLRLSFVSWRLGYN